jgi:hypothetical protein
MAGGEDGRPDGLDEGDGNVQGGEANGGLGGDEGLMADLAKLAGGMRVGPAVPVRMAVGRPQVPEYAEEIQQKRAQEEAMRSAGNRQGSAHTRGRI